MAVEARKLEHIKKCFSVTKAATVGCRRRQLPLSVCTLDRQASHYIISAIRLKLLSYYLLTSYMK